MLEGREIGRIYSSFEGNLLLEQVAMASLLKELFREAHGSQIFWASKVQKRADSNHSPTGMQNPRYALAPAFSTKPPNLMSNFRKQFLIERSMLCLDKLRDNTGLSAPRIEAAVRDVYRSPQLLSYAPTPSAVAAYFAGKRPIPFDPVGPAPSWLQAIEVCFENSTRYFFHPLPNLLGGPLLSPEKIRTKQKGYPTEWIAQADRAGDIDFAAEGRASNQRLSKLARSRSKGSRTEQDLDWVHANMYALERDVRDILLVSRGLSGYRRRCESMEQQSKLLLEHGNFEALTAALAIFLESNLIRDAERAIVSRDLVIQLLPSLRLDRSLSRVSECFEAGIVSALRSVTIARYDAFEMILKTLPASWHTLAHSRLGEYRVRKLIS